MISVTADSPELIYVDTSLGQMHVRLYENKGPTLICLHPMPYSGGYYDSFCKHLTKESNCSAVSIDMIGYGRSEKIKEPISIHDYATSSIEVIKTLINDDRISKRVNLLGFHTGSAIANEIGILESNLINKIIFVTYPYFNQEKRQEMLSSLSTTPLNEDLESLRSMWEFTIENRAEGVTLEKAMSNFLDQLQNLDKGWFGFHAMFNYISEERLPHLKLPTLVINDQSSLTKATKAASDLISEMNYIELEGTQGGIFELNIDQITAHVISFLNQ